MRVLAICQDELVIRSLDDVLLPSFEVEFLVESRPLARRLHDAGIEVIAGDPRRVDTYLKADISPSTCFIVEDNGRRSVKKILVGDPRRRRHADLRAAHRRRGPARRPRTLRAEFPDVTAPRSVGADPADARHRAQPLDDARARAAVPALLRRRRSRADPAAQRSRSRRAGQRPGAAQPAAPHQDDGDHRRDAGRDAAGEPADGEHARHPRRADHAGVVPGVRAHRDRRRAAALLRRPAAIASIWSSIIIPSSPATARSSRTSAPTTDRPPRS